MDHIAMDRLPVEPTKPPPAMTRTTGPGWVIAVFLVASGAILSIWYVAIRAHEQGVVQERQRELLAISELKIGYIEAWLAERRADARLAAMSPAISQSLQYGDADAPVRFDGSALAPMLEAIKDSVGYEAALLVDHEGRRRMGVGSPVALAHIHTEEAARMALAAGDAVISGFRGRPGDKHFNIDVAAPVFADSNRKAAPLGALILHINPDAQLYPLLQQWPSPSRTAETMLVNRAGNEVVYLNPLRHRDQPGTHAPVSSPQLPAAMAARGERGVRQGIDYRGVPVFAAIGQIPGTSWIMVAKVDRDEVLAPVRSQALWSGGLIAALLAALGTATLLWWRQREAEYALAAREEVDRSQGESARILRTFLDAAPGVSALLATDATILVANAATARALGKPSEALAGLNMLDLLPPAVAEQRKAWFEQVLSERRPLRFEDPTGGRWFEHHACPVLDSTGEVASIAWVAVEFTERKEAELALRESQASLAHAQALAHVGSWRLDIQADALAWSDETYHIFGIPPGTPLTLERFLACVHPNDRKLVSDAWNAALAGVAYDIEHRVLVGDEVKWVREVAEVRQDAAGQPAIALGSIQDITDRKEAEQRRLEFSRRQRDSLVREVHHRIKNHLQGLAGLLRQHIFRYPALKQPVEAIVAQIGAIAIVHGLQGREKSGEVHIASLVQEIVGFVGGLTSMPIEAEMPPCAAACALAEEESIPVALILNELVTNAVRHGWSRPGATVNIVVRCDAQSAAILIRNSGHCPAALDFAASRGLGTGLTLVKSLLPPAGASVSIKPDHEGCVEATLRLGPPVLIRPEQCLAACAQPQSSMVS